ncbi:MAG: WecB/TagA/CpsF family glycosyltransferase [Clostridia bacterium]|nr:WecB/TagA/CpsF family glycosyltransferase [Clostridia bacterium]
MKVNVLGTLVDNITREQAKSTFFAFLSSGKTNTIYTPNAEICMEAYQNSTFREVLNRGTLVIPDGQGVVLASRILKTPVKEKVGGFKLTLSIFESNQKVSCYLLGSKPGVTDKAVKIINEKYKNITICGHRNGYFSEKDIPGIIDDINQSHAQFLMVGLGAPKQEIFIDQHQDQINCAVIMGVGGSIDVIAGEVKKTPDIFVKLSLEWFHRLITQPKRLKRMLKIPVFLLICLKKRIFQQNY